MKAHFPDPDAAALDVFAMEAMALERVGNPANWFYTFRRALEGLCARRWGVERHHAMLATWLPGVTFRHYEYELASCLFCMDSTLECAAFTLNALGWALRPSEFASLRDVSALKRIAPKAVVDSGPKRIQGFAALYPSVVSLWRAHEDDVKLIVDNHDVSKHRSATWSGGTMRRDPSPAILESLGMEFTVATGYYVAPMKDLFLYKRPKLPLPERSPQPEHWIDFLPLKERFDHLVAQTLTLAVADLRATFTVA